ncbi:MAG: type II toxin-antitoxin system ParD family antitoxin [Cyanobacteria bacterium J06639_1]
MQLALPPDLDAFVRRQLSSGKYQNFPDLLLSAIELLKQQEDVYQGRLLQLQNDAATGLEALEEGRVRDGASAIAEMRAGLRDRYQDSDT